MAYYWAAGTGFWKSNYFGNCDGDFVWLGEYWDGFEQSGVVACRARGYVWDCLFHRHCHRRYFSCPVYSTAIKPLASSANGINFYDRSSGSYQCGGDALSLAIADWFCKFLAFKA